MIVIALVLFTSIGLPWANKKLTYIEYTSMNSQSDTCVQLANNGEMLTQEFTMPYNIIEGISVKIGTYARDNNSMWHVKLSDENQKIVYQDDFNASQIEDNCYYKIKFKHNQKVTKGNIYTLSIVAEDVSDLSNIAFYVSQASTIDGKMFINNQKMDADLCFEVYGGEKDYWWTGFAVIVLFCLIILFARCYFVEKQGRKIWDDIYIQAIMVGVIAFLLLASFSATGNFSDENDNMYGGMVISNGGVLYRDYVTQHTPVMYYLCAVFSFLGAGSVQQFRLSYYLLEAIVWAFVYARYSKHFGKKQILLLTILEIIGLSSLVAPYGTQILSDGLQGILTVILLLEYLLYIKEKELGWPRCIIVSGCIWGSFGAAFVSAYALIWVAFGVLIHEICEWHKNGFKIKRAIERYYKLIISVTVPVLIAVAYFKFNHALKIAFDQFYRFNREVYPKYYVMGENLAQPFINGVQNFFSIIANGFNSIIAGTASNVTILQLVVIGMAFSVLTILSMKKRYWESVMLFFVMIFSATRGYDFHGIAAWYVAILIVCLYIGLIEEKLQKISKPVLGLCAIVLLSTYIISVGDNLLYTQESVSETESKVIELTENENNKGIYLDLYASPSLYYAYKGRYAINRAVYMLPWYMDWYEKDEIEDLFTYHPKVVVYNEEEDAWGYTHYAPAFVTQLEEYYHRLSNNNEKAGYNIWLRND